MAFVLGAQSRAKLKGVKPELVAVVERAIQITGTNFRITEGLRSVTRQKELFAAGASETMNSRHLTGHAVDVVALVNCNVRWDWPLYPKIAAAFKQASKELATPIVWGGDWPRLRDGPHFELDRKRYP
ncbi:M15 family metallopeptidase [Brevundimonas variabilis]|uniref:Peptidoglycan L-alanyl-D-glutamate endopeptidase CwlK n=1 Tax=Brevundimonas variabilis TaxID=74312 RepID=A0A7W9FFK2_9CAUL|nr:M15 family metallopeptidase [Brevundimonas variabilis]MBB5747415.1 peptidoglycan L-alanyl-D-glutamate endopeptidase CwlK [Brevundimonas variabilis]